MPFAIWCTTCPKPTIIGQGVRFNAEKKKIGNYLSTPIFSFRMKHNVCGGAIEIRTDPQNTAYVVTEGAKKRDTGNDKLEDGDIVIRTEEEKERLRNDAFAALEVKIDDKKQAKHDKSRIEELQEAKVRDWDDPYAASERLRHAFRADRKVREKDAKASHAIQDKMSFGLELLAETAEDRRRAGLIEFGGNERDALISKANSKPLFSDLTSATTSTTKKPKNKKLATIDRRKVQLQKELRENTRAALDPFLQVGKPNASASKPINGVRRKRSSEMDDENHGSHTVPTLSTNNTMMSPLVDYESD